MKIDILMLMLPIQEYGMPSSSILLCNLQVFQSFLHSDLAHFLYLLLCILSSFGSCYN